MNDVSNRAVREFSEFLNSIEADFPKPTCTTAYEITMKSTIVSALITLDTEKQMDEFSTIMKDLVEYDFSIAKEQLEKRLNIA